MHCPSLKIKQTVVFTSKIKILSFLMKDPLYKRNKFIKKPYHQLCVCNVYV